MANVHVPGHDEAADHVMGAHPAPPALDHVQRRLLDAGRVLVAGGWLVLTYTIGNGGADTNAEHALFGFALLLLGVFLVTTLSPVAHRFPGATRLGTAVADAVVFYFLAPAGN